MAVSRWWWWWGRLVGTPLSHMMSLIGSRLSTQSSRILAKSELCLHSLIGQWFVQCTYLLFAASGLTVDCLYAVTAGFNHGTKPKGFQNSVINLRDSAEHVTGANVQTQTHKNSNLCALLDKTTRRLVYFSPFPKETKVCTALFLD